MWNNKQICLNKIWNLFVYVLHPMTENQTKCTFSTDLQFYVTELDHGLDGNAPHNFVLINGKIQDYHFFMENFDQRNWTKKYEWLNGVNSSYLSNREFQNHNETTIIINTSSAKLKMQFSGSPEIYNRTSHLSNSKSKSLLILGNTKQRIYNIFNHSSTFIII